MIQLEYALELQLGPQFDIVYFAVGWLLPLQECYYWSYHDRFCESEIW